MSEEAATRGALARIGVHLLSAVLVVVAGVAFAANATGGAEVWIGRLVSGAATLYAGLGVAVFKEGVPALRHSPGDPRLEPEILREASSRALRDTAVLAFTLAIVLLFLPPTSDVRVVLFAVVGLGYGNFFVRQLKIRRRAFAPGEPLPRV